MQVIIFIIIKILCFFSLTFIASIYYCFSLATASIYMFYFRVSVSCCIQYFFLYNFSTIFAYINNAAIFFTCGICCYLFYILMLTMFKLSLFILITWISISIYFIFACITEIYSRVLYNLIYIINQIILLSLYFIICHNTCNIWTGKRRSANRYFYV